MEEKLKPQCENFEKLTRKPDGNLSPAEPKIIYQLHKHLSSLKDKQKLCDINKLYVKETHTNSGVHELEKELDSTDFLQKKNNVKLILVNESGEKFTTNVHECQHSKRSFQY